jgi:hypothetical protein
MKLRTPGTVRLQSIAQARPISAKCHSLLGRILALSIPSDRAAPPKKKPATAIPSAVQTGGRSFSVDRRAVDSSGTFSTSDHYSA